MAEGVGSPCVTRVAALVLGFRLRGLRLRRVMQQQARRLGVTSGRLLLWSSP